MFLQLAARQMLRQATAEGSFSTLPCVYVSLQLETSRHAGRRAGSHIAALALHRKLSLRRESRNSCQCSLERDDEDWEAEDEEAISRASIAMSADAVAREQVRTPPNLCHCPLREGPIATECRASTVKKWRSPSPSIVHLQAAAAGPQTDTAHFACWEAHTRGVGSKLMAAMGYRQGQGLGPIEVSWLPMRLLSRNMAMQRFEKHAG